MNYSLRVRVFFGEVRRYRSGLGVVNLIIQDAGLRIIKRPTPGHGEAEDRQENERQRHHPWGLVGVFVNVLVSGLAAERQQPHAKHVEGSDPRRHHGQGDQQEMVGMFVVKRVGMGQDRVFAIPPAEQRDSRDGQQADQHGIRGNRHLVAQAAHLQHVLLVMAAVNDAPRTEEQQRLEAGVREQMKEPGHPAADAQAEHHIA